MESYLIERTRDSLARSDGKNGKHSILSDSLKLALASVIGCVASRSGLIGRLRRPSFETTAFLFYALWPMIAVILVPITCIFAVRDMNRGRNRQATTAIAVSILIAVAGFFLFGLDR